MQEEKILIAGFGGQGIMLLGKIIAEGAIVEGKYTTYIKSYGAEMRGGTAYCLVKVSAGEIASPIFEYPTAAIMMNQPSFDKFKKTFKENTIVLANSSLVKDEEVSSKAGVFSYPFNDAANSMGNIKIANIIALGAFIKRSGIIKRNTVEEILVNYFSGKKDILEMDLKAMEEGWKIK